MGIVAVGRAATAENVRHDEQRDVISETTKWVTNFSDHRIHESTLLVHQPSMRVFHSHSTMKGNDSLGNTGA
jgi:hypothetical protein